MDIEDITEEELSALRHEEVVSALKQVISACDNKSNLQPYIEKNTKLITALVEKLGQIEVKKEIRLISNQDNVIKSIKEMATELNKTLCELKEILKVKPVIEVKKEYEFFINRNVNNLITSVTAKQK